MVQSTGKHTQDKVRRDWAKSLEAKGLIDTKQSRRNRSQVECGVSIEWIAKVAASVAQQPQLYGLTTTQNVYNHLISPTCDEHQCSFVKLIPPEHTSYATAVVCHSWGTDFLELVATLVDDFNEKWDAHKAYKNAHKSATRVLAEGEAAKEAARAVDDARRHLDSLLEAAERLSEWSQPGHASHWPGDAVNRRQSASFHHTTSVGGAHADMRNNAAWAPPCTGLPDALQPKLNRLKSSTSMALTGERAAAVPSSFSKNQQQQAHEAMVTRDAINDCTLPVDAGLKRKLLGYKCNVTSAVANVKNIVGYEKGTVNSKAEQQPQPPALQSRPSCLPPQQSVNDAGVDRGGPTATIVGPVNPHRTNAAAPGVANNITVVQSPRRSTAAASTPPADDVGSRRIKRATRNIIVQRKFCNAVSSRRQSVALIDDSNVGPGSPSVLSKAGQLQAVRTAAPQEDAVQHAASAVPQHSIYRSATKHADLTQLLKPLDEQSMLHIAIQKAEKVLEQRIEEAKVAKEQVNWAEEKKKLQGYYVWIDIFALDLFIPSTQVMKIEASNSFITLDSTTKSSTSSASGPSTTKTQPSPSPSTDLNSPRLSSSASSGSLRTQSLQQSSSRVSSPLKAASPRQPAAGGQQGNMDSNDGSSKAATPTTSQSQLKDPNVPRSVDNGSPDMGARLQKCHSQSLAAAERLIHVVGRTYVIVDEQWRVVSRLWCLFEIWCSLKHKAALVILTTPTALASHQATAGRNASQTHDTLPDITGVASRCGPSQAGSLPPPPEINISAAGCSRQADQVLILGRWGHELTSAKTAVNSLRQISAMIEDGLEESRSRQAQRSHMIRRVYTAFLACDKNWKDIQQPNWKDLEGARDRLLELCSNHFGKELQKAKDVKAVSSADLELGVWRLANFAAAQLELRKDEPLWCKEARRYAAAAHKSFAGRFSSSYVDQLLRAAGTFDDMKTLKSYVHGLCHHKVQVDRREDEEDYSDDGE